MYHACQWIVTCWNFLNLWSFTRNPFFSIQPNSVISSFSRPHFVVTMNHNTFIVNCISFNWQFLLYFNIPACGIIYMYTNHIYSTILISVGYGDTPPVRLYRLCVQFIISQVVNGHCWAVQTCPWNTWGVTQSQTGPSRQLLAWHERTIKPVKILSDEVLPTT